MRLFFVLFALVVALPAVGSTSPLAGARLVTLPNGLRIIHREHRSAPLVAIDVWVRAGSVRERHDESGVAHFVEHLLFKGTPTRKPGQIDAAIEDLGATLGAGTTRDAAHYFTTVSAEHAAGALEVIADAVRNASLDPSEVERERTVILDELARSRNDGRKRAINLLYGELFPDSALGRPVLGQPESIRTVSRETIHRFYRRWYRPENTTVVLVGDIGPVDSERLASRYFGDWVQGPAANDEPGRSSNLPTALEISEGWAGSGVQLESRQDAGSIAAGLVVARLLADGSSGRVPELVKEASAPVEAPVGRRPSALLIKPKPPLAEVLAEFSPHPGGACVLVTAATSATDHAAALKPVEAAFSSLRKEGVTASEIDFARRRTLGAFLALVETYAGQARALGEYDVIGDYRIAVELADRIMSVEPEDVSDFASRWFEPTKIVRTEGAVRSAR